MIVIGMGLLLMATVLASLGVWLRGSGRNQRVIWVFVALMLAGLWIWCFVIHDLRYDLRMRTAFRQFDALPLPAATTRSETRSLFGLIFGNSNHCDYFIGNLLRSELSLEQLQKHYSGFRITSPLQAEHPDPPAVEAWRENSELVPVPYYLREAVDWKLPAEGAPKGRLYLLSVSDGGYPPNDIRCH